MTDDIKKLIAEVDTISYSPGRRHELLHEVRDALEAEHQRAEEAIEAAADLVHPDSEFVHRIRAERDALRTTIQRLLDSRDLDWDLPPTARERMKLALYVEGDGL